MKIRDRFSAAWRGFLYGVNDELTGLADRRALVRRREINASAVVLIDIDDLKQVNDGPGGHSAGDQVLKDVADALLKHARGIDIVVRYGGDEFLLILPKTDEQGAQVLVARVKDSLPDGVNISFGIRTHEGGGAIPLNLLIIQADELLYLNKAANKAGRRKML